MYLQVLPAQARSRLKITILILHPSLTPIYMLQDSQINPCDVVQDGKPRWHMKSFSSGFKAYFWTAGTDRWQQDTLSKIFELHSFGENSQVY